MVQGIYKFTKMIDLLFCPNIYGMLGILRGGIILGIMPTTIAQSAVIRQFLLYGEVSS